MPTCAWGPRAACGSVCPSVVNYLQALALLSGGRHDPQNCYVCVHCCDLLQCPKRNYQLGALMTWPHREGGPQDQARAAFDRMPDEDRRALYNGDLGLDDVLDDELGLATRHHILKLVERWGDASV
jgi:hypothetical protein